jgi:hypothetical protein
MIRRSLPGSKGKDPNILRSERHLSEVLGSQVTIEHSIDGAGTITIRYFNLEEYEGIEQHLLDKR